MKESLRRIETMSIADMLVWIDELYGRENLNDECNVDEVRNELALQVRRNFRETYPKIYPDADFWIKVINEYERIG